MRGFFPGSVLAKSVEPTGLEPKCGHCGLYKGCKSPKMPPTGEGRRHVLIVAEAPGGTEDAQNTQLVGDSGQLLRAELRALNVNLDRDCWKTNAIICRPPKNATPTNDQIDDCLPNLNKTIKLYQPDVIIPLGLPACRAIIGPIWKEEIGAMEKWAGWHIPCIQHNAWVCPTHHPAWMKRQRDERNYDGVADIFWRRHLAAAFAIEGRPWATIPDYASQIKVILDADQAAAIIDQMVAAGGVFAFDYETNMLKPDGPLARIVSCSICWRGRRTIAYPWHGAAIAATGRFLASRWPKIASNMKFEERWSIKEFRVPVNNWYFDTMQNAHILDCRPGINSIKFQSFIRLGQPAYNHHIEPFLKSNNPREVNQILKQVDLRDLLLYNGLDSLLEFLVARQQAKELNYPAPVIV